MNLIRNYMSFQQVANLCGYVEQRVRLAVNKRELNDYYPYPDYLGQSSRSGVRLVVCDEKLKDFLFKATTHAQRRFKNQSYNPLYEASKYAEWV